MKNKLGLDTIFILVAIIVVALFLIIALVNKGEYVEENPTNKTGIIQQANDIELLKFNSKIEGYNGTQTGQYLSALFKVVEESNKNNPDKQIKISGIESADKLNNTATYTVTLGKDQNGYYNSVKIEEKK